MAFEIENGVLKKYTEEDGVTEVVIPDSVTSIGDWAFEDCRSLTSVEIPDSVTSIGDDAFIRCSSLTSILIPDSVTSIGNSAFFNCSSLTSIVIPDSVTSIGDYAFKNCSSLTSIVIPDSVKNIGKEILENTGWLAQQTGDFIINGKVLYKYNGNNNNAIVPDGITVIGEDAFRDCSNITSIVIPDSVMSIGSSAFWKCNSLTSVEIPDSVTSIGSSAFFNCNSLTSVVIPDSVTSIGRDAFEDCNSLKEVYVNSLEAWCNIKFGCWRSNPLEYANDLYLNGEKITELVIPDSVTTIGQYAFYRCGSLTSITIPGSVKMIGHNALNTSIPLIIEPPVLTNKLESDFLLDLVDICTYDNIVTIYLFQSGAKIQKETSSVLLDDPTAAAAEIARQLRLMPKKFTNKVCSKILKFAFQYRDAIGKREFNELYKAMSDKEAGATKVMITSAAQLEDYLYPEDELDTVETKTVNHPSEQLCLDNIDMEEVDKTIRNDCGYIYSLVESYLSKNTLCYKDTDIPVADYVLKCIIVCPYMDKFVDTVKEIGKTIEPAGFMEFIRYISQINRDIINLYQNPELLDVLYLFGDNELVESLIKLNSKWHDWSIYNKAGRVAEKRALEVVYYSDTFAAMNYCEKRGYLGRYAEMRSMDEQTFRDTVLDNFDLDDNYEKVYDIGYEVRVSLNADLTFSIFNSAQNKYVKSFPKKSDDPEKRDKCAEDFSILSKNIKKCINKRKDILWKNCLKEEYLEANLWIRAYWGNPVLRRVAETIVWKLSEFDGEEITGTKFFVMKGKALSDIDGNAVNLPENGKICPAHITDLSKEDAEKWNVYFKENKIEQAFEQLDEVCIEGLEEIDVNERYSGKDLEIFMLQELKSRGFSYSSNVFERGRYGATIDHNAYLMRFYISIRTSDTLNGTEIDKTVVDSSYITTKVKNYVVNVMDYTMAYNCCYNDNAEDLKMYLPNFSRSYLEKLLKYCNEHQKLNCLPVLMDYKHTCYGEDDLSSDEYEL